MLPFLKKKPEAASTASQTLAWHPSFRNYERLPDVKAVRTVFFVNSVAIVIALALLVWFALREYRAMNLRSEITNCQRQIDRDRHGSDQAIATYKKFQTEEKKPAEVETFRKACPVFSDLLIHIGDTLPKNIALTSLDMRETGLTMRGVVRGAPELASGEASAYVEQLGADKTIKALFDEVSLTNISRNPQNGRLNLELFLKFKGAKKK